jgi:pSer/pThr/pTyr-binding forkhead associated (FHA) protein
MIQLQVLNGKMAGSIAVARHFPLFVGRGTQDGFVLEDAGIWDSHVTIDLNATNEFELKSRLEALTVVNGSAVKRHILRNGDLIELGATHIRFALSDAEQKRLSLEEVGTWILAGATGLIQILVLYSLGF